MKFFGLQKKSSFFFELGEITFDTVFTIFLFFCVQASVGLIVADLPLFIVNFRKQCCRVWTNLFSN